MSEEFEYYEKVKYVYIVQAAGRSKIWGFSNIKAAVDWFQAGTLFVTLVIKDYDKVVRSIRKHGKYDIYHSGDNWTIKAVELVGHKVRSKRRKKS